MLPKINPAARRVLKSFVVVQSSLRQPIERTLFGKKPYTTRCPISYQFGRMEILVPQGYAFDGPSIPRLFWWMTGLSPMDDETLLPSLIHDYICDNPEVAPRVVGDGVFVTALSCSVWNGRTVRGVPRCRRMLMYLAVRLWSASKQWRRS
jgi:hypothetical protein